jgi:hypothetical protein
VEPGRGKGGDNVSWAEANLTRPKKKIHTVDSAAIQIDSKDLNQQ